MAQAKLKLTPVVVDDFGDFDDQISKGGERKKNN